MKRINKRLGIPIVAVCILCGAGAARADTVTDWNSIMQATVTAPPTNPFFQARWGAIAQLAVFEAVNAVTGDYEPYLGTITAPAWASPDAAAIADGPAKVAGIQAGEDAATAMLLLRADDGAALAAGVPYTPGTNPGDWQ